MLQSPSPRQPHPSQPSRTILRNATRDKNNIKTIPTVALDLPSPRQCQSLRIVRVQDDRPSRLVNTHDVPCINLTFHPAPIRLSSHHPLHTQSSQPNYPNQSFRFFKANPQPSQWPPSSRTLLSSRVREQSPLRSWDLLPTSSYLLFPAYTDSYFYSCPRWWLRCHVSSLHGRPRIHHPTLP